MAEGVRPEEKPTFVSYAIICPAIAPSPTSPFTVPDYELLYCWVLLGLGYMQGRMSL